MKKIALIILAVLAGIIVFQYLMYSCEGRKKDNHIAELQLALANCINAPEVITVDTVEKYLKDTIRLSYKYRVLDTVYVTDPITRKEYTGKYNHPQFELNWSAQVTGTLDEMNINPPSLIKSLIITKEKVVPQTLIQPPGETIRERSHLYTSLNTGFTTKRLNSVDVGLMYIRKEGWGLQVGVGTDFDNLLFRTGLIIKLK